MNLEFTLNGRLVSLEGVSPSETLLEILQERLHFSGTRMTCGIGICGACTVLVDGEVTTACLLLAPMAAGRHITTIEGLAPGDDELHLIQQAFVEAMGLQCGYCTPGFILATHALLHENPAAGEDEIKEYLSGNLCRCGSYYKIIDAVKLAQQRWKA
jgi:carbon-monoxide dehydrogenase small subunit